MLFIINELGFENLASFLWCVKQIQPHSTLFGPKCTIIIVRTIVLYHIRQGSQAICKTINQKLAGT
jgi:hypothetical protein